MDFIASEARKAPSQRVPAQSTGLT